MPGPGKGEEPLSNLPPELLGPEAEEEIRGGTLPGDAGPPPLVRADPDLGDSKKQQPPNPGA